MTLEQGRNWQSLMNPVSRFAVPTFLGPRGLAKPDLDVRQSVERDGIKS